MKQNNSKVAGGNEKEAGFIFNKFNIKMGEKEVFKNQLSNTNTGEKKQKELMCTKISREIG